MSASKNAKLLSVQMVALFAALLTIDVSVLCFEKIGAAAAGNAVGNELEFYLRLLQLPWTWYVIVLSPLQLLVWTKILSKTDLSVAYPVSSLCFPLTMIASAIFFHEHVSWMAWLGGILIASGIAIVGGEDSSHDVLESESSAGSVNASVLPAYNLAESKLNVEELTAQLPVVSVSDHSR